MTEVIRLAESDADVAKVCAVLRELRTNLSEERILVEIQEQRAAGYRVAFAEVEGEVAAVAGFVVAKKLAWGKHLYVDDLVTGARWRSTGVGGLLMDWLKAHALEAGCRELHLDSGVQRFGAHRFYLRHGFDITSHHFAMNLD